MTRIAATDSADAAAIDVSNGAQSGPPIGAEEGPLSILH